MWTVLNTVEKTKFIVHLNVWKNTDWSHEAETSILATTVSRINIDHFSFVYKL